MHRDVAVCSIGHDELIAVLLLRRQRRHATPPASGLWNGRAPTARRSRGRAQPLSEAKGEQRGSRARVVGVELHAHRDLAVCSIGRDELTAVLLLRQQRGHAAQPAPGLWNGRTRELERDGGELPLFAFAEVALDKAALHKHRLPRCVRSGHPDAARNDGPVAPPPDDLGKSRCRPRTAAPRLPQLVQTGQRSVATLAAARRGEAGAASSSIPRGKEGDTARRDPRERVLRSSAARPLHSYVNGATTATIG